MSFHNSSFKLSPELPFSNSSSPFSLFNLSRSSHNLFLSHPKSSFPTVTFSSLKTTHNSSPSPNPTPPWLTKTNSPKRVSESTVKEQSSQVQPSKHTTPVERIVFRLRNLGLTEEDEPQQQEEQHEEEVKLSATTVTGDEKLSELLKIKWVRPDVLLDEENEDEEEKLVVPWKREEEREMGGGGGGEVEQDGFKKRTLKAPSLAELTLEDELLRRLRREGMHIRERVSVPKAGLTQEVMEKIHETWRKEELVRLKFHEELAKNMRIAHQIVERRTGGLVTWKAGSVMMVYRGKNYQGPASPKELDVREGDGFFVPDVSSGGLSKTEDSNAASSLGNGESVRRNSKLPENMTREEAEYNALLDGLGPRFVEWWGTGIPPVDADLFPPVVPGYKTPYRLLPTGMRSRLTSAELTDLRRIAKSLPSHFALGRNRNHQGLACAILKLWEKSLIAKIAVKPGIQNTNNKLMADELSALTGGTLLLRNKYFIVIYRGKDFVPTGVAEVLAERQELTKQVQDVEEKVRCRAVAVTPSGQGEATAPAGSLAEFYEAQARWGRDVSSEERERMVEEATKAKNVKIVKQIEHKLSLAGTKILRAEKLLAKIESSMVQAGPDYDQEIITDEERVVFRRIGLRMKPYLPLGIRGVFGGVIENMHLHWKHRELVKLITKQKTLAFVEDTARLLEYESGGILVAIEKVSKGFALIYYRGKNYKRPITLRPRNLLTKAKALKRSVAMQRHEALSNHITELETTIEQMKQELGLSEDDRSVKEVHENQLDQISELTDSEDDEDSDDFEDEEDAGWDEDENSEFSELEVNEHP
ncbi:CRM-domain containing factor CFM3, chloroplastic/mitochondrial [Vicia villosa]|uniref:CRM-domain containing factor CFM3, chloroplastic/mitochondrial n=1 Tax=Vicia villosa TaxID=3911 RepID=UPI00273C36A1|nr:CRM-domain containing factor CFM3, chloroplastic/mitochondrial [Vicia villosa]XP_058722427.1 CRM-domain containing factor CFM3, chloroplastic/mitochondrial [Vicia villosa]